MSAVDHLVQRSEKPNGESTPEGSDINVQVDNSRNETVTERRKQRELKDNTGHGCDMTCGDTRRMKLCECMKAKLVFELNHA